MSIKSFKKISLIALFVLMLTFSVSLFTGFCQEIPDGNIGELKGWTQIGEFKKEPPYVIGCSQHYTTNDYVILLKEQFIQEVERFKKAGLIKDYYFIDAEAKISKQISDIEDLVAKGCDAIVIAPMSKTALIPVIDKVHKMGIPTFFYQADFGGENYGGIRLSDDRAFGRIGAEWLVEQMNGKGNLLVLRGIPGVGADTYRWTEGAEPVFKQYPDIKIVGMARGDWAYDKGRAASASIIAANKKIDGIFTVGGQMTMAAVEELKKAGRPLVPAFGEDYNGLFRIWKEWEFPCLCSCKLLSEPSLCVQAAINVLQGIPIPKRLIMPAPMFTLENRDKFIRPDMPDQIWVSNSLNDEVLKKVYRVK
ncbi:hypothetical protein ES704_03299 [subsurface metagenome]|jgi:ribose transport system substrate-binding protein